MRRGIDVSTYQGIIKWGEVHASGVDFAMIKATQGRSERNSSVRLFEDSKFRVNLVGAHDNDIRCGTYHYLTAESVKDAIEEAEYYLSVISPFRSLVSLWAAVDVESKYLPKDKTLLTQIVHAFCDKVAAAGFKPMVYTNPNFLKNRLNDISKYPLWLALWRNKNLVPQERVYKNMYLWQWGKENVNGIAGGVDENLMIKDIEVDKPVVNVDKNEQKLDNTASSWAQKSVDWALYYGILQGSTGGDLMLHKPVTREEMCVMLQRVCGKMLNAAALTNAEKQKGG